jgi:hypothetical protein
MLKPVIRLNSAEFDRTLRQYMAGTKRAIPEVLNQKAYSISNAATKMTYKANAQTIKGQVGAVGTRLKINKTGKRKGKFSKGGVIHAGQEEGKAPRLALIINASRGRRGLPGLHGADMKAAMKKVLNSRLRAIGFIRAGWLSAVAVFAKRIGKPVKQSTKAMAQRTAAMMGGGKPAEPGVKSVATFWNSASANPQNTSSNNVQKYAKEGLAAAMHQEMARMKAHMEKRLQREANKHALR